MSLHTPPTRTPSLSNSSADLTAISKNWSLPLTHITYILPAALNPPTHPSSWPPALLASLRRLSELTPGQIDRAHSLLETYFRARIRCNLYRVQQDRGIYAKLEVVDVQDAIRSLELMNRGQAVEDRTAREGSVLSARSTSSQTSIHKRKVSIKDERNDEPQAKLLRLTNPPHPDHTPSQRRGIQASTTSNSTSALANSPKKLHAPSLPHAGTLIMAKRTLSDVPAIMAKTSLPHNFTPIMAKRALSVSALKLSPKPISSAASETPSKPVSYSPSPLTALLNTPPTPHSTALANRLPPVSALIQEAESRGRAVALLGKNLSVGEEDFSEKSSTISEEDGKEKEKETVELKVKKLELEEAEAALEVAMQRHVVARNKAAVARAEMEGGTGVEMRRVRSAEK
jgi:hypothetical protein